MDKNPEKVRIAMCTLMLYISIKRYKPLQFKIIHEHLKNWAREPRLAEC